MKEGSEREGGTEARNIATSLTLTSKKMVCVYVQACAR